MTGVTIWTGAEVKALRAACRLTQNELAEALRCSQRTVSFWEGRPTAKVGLAHQAGLDRLLADADHGAQDRFRRLIGDDVNRREFFAATGVVVGASALRGAEAPTVTPDAIGHLRTTIHSAMLLDDQLGSNAAQPIIEAQARACTALLRDCPSKLRPELQSLTSEATASNAWAAWDQGEYEKSDRLFVSAHDLATDAGDEDVAVGILCHRTQLAIWTHRYQAAADLADSTKRLSVGDPRMADYVLLQSAQAYAYSGKARKAWPLLDRISGEHSDPTTPDISYAYYMSDWLTGLLTSKSLQMAGETRAAVETIEASIDRIPETEVRDRALALLYLTRMTVRDDLDRACEAAERALALSKINTSPRLREVYFDTRAALAPWARSSAVRRLDGLAAGVV
ncbi:helix-turn-helix domain-containing protein [Nocardia sp. NBC_00508]|uniref:helix-turn-helix transcriptional regulator n=1 Tax=Nocardia sp. NBC_00508 TaxID=2975992 RepID=UPI002E8221C5|nr:helix-turn-helix transcriptional regulator [Nocardia sp. NBC_00508]WUD64866.1 helix-turn-helix domain-containing protein [Nocardia sp. NBC_00508]